MDRNEEVFLGLNQNGVILFAVLLFFCFPLAWLPWIIGSCKVQN